MPHLCSRDTSKRMTALSATILIPTGPQLSLDKTLSIVRLRFAPQRFLITLATTLINQTSRMALSIGLMSPRSLNTGWELSRSSSKALTSPESLTLAATFRWLKTSSREELIPWWSIRNQWIKTRGTSLKCWTRISKRRRVFLFRRKCLMIVLLEPRLRLMPTATLFNHASAQNVKLVKTSKLETQSSILMSRLETMRKSPTLSSKAVVSSTKDVSSQRDLF